LERAILYRVPGYFLVRGAVGSFPGLSTEMRPEPSLVKTDDGWAFALLIERERLGFCTVFLPDSPTPTSGSVRIAEATRVRSLDVSMLNVLACLIRSGTGACALAGRVLGDRRAVADIKGTTTEMLSGRGETEARHGTESL
jgi:hypothetical protein